MPSSGFWLVLLQAVLILTVARWGSSRIGMADAEPSFSPAGDHAYRPRRT